MGRLALIAIITSFIMMGSAPLIAVDDLPIPEQQVLLTPEEQEYLEQLESITMCVDPDWLPYEHVDEEGRFTGIAADLIELVSQRLNIPFELVSTEDWPETLEVSRAGGCMIIPFLNQTPQREEWLIFTEPLFIDPNVFITREEHPFISDPGELEGSTIVFPEGTAMEKNIRRDYPNLVILNTHDEIESFRMVEMRKADMTLRSLTIAAYIIRSEGFINLKIAGQIPEYTNYLRVGVLKDLPVLRDILSEAILTITPAERREIVNRHVYIRMDTPVNYRLIFGGLGLLLFLTGSGFFWSYRLKKLNEDRRILLDNIKTQIWYMIDEYTYGAVNQAHADFHGVKITDLSFKDRYGVLAGEMVEKIHQNNREIFQTGRPIQFGTWIPNASGELRFLFIKKTPRVQPNGAVEYIVCSAEDITEQKKAEEDLQIIKKDLEQALSDLQENEARFRNLSENTTAGIFIMKGTRFVLVNPAMAEITGYSEQELISRDISVFIHPDHRSEIVNRASDRQKGKQVPIRYEAKILTKKGETRWVEFTAGLSTYHEEPSTIGTVYDITNLKQLENEIRFNAGLQELIGAISAEFITTDHSTIDLKIDRMLERCGVFLDVDRTFLFQFTPDLRFMSNTHEWCAEGIPPVKDSVQNFPSAEVPWISTFAQERKIFYVPDVAALPDSPDKRELERQQIQSVLCLPLIKNQQLLGYFGFDAVRSPRKLTKELINTLQVLGNILADALIKDQSEQDIRNARHQAELANAAKSEFLANMSHEVRTPLNAIIGFTELTLKTGLNLKQRDHLKKIHAASHTLIKTINDILDFSKIEAGKLELESTEFTLSDVIHNTINLLTERAVAKGLEIYLVLGPEVPGTLIGDPFRLEQVLTNLVSNAIKFTEQGEIVIRVTCSEPNQDPVIVHFSVQDNGIGITQEQKTRLFSPFVQADGSTTRQHGGTGLGLAICKSLVTMMGGTISVESEPGQGSTFSFTSRFGRSQKVDSAFPATPPELTGLKVLIVDDSLTARELLADLMKSYRFRVVTAASGQEALARLQETPPDDPFSLILMDWRMPEMDGIETTRQIRQSLQLKQLPLIIMITAYGRDEVMHQAEQAGINAFLLKPINESLIFNTIMEVLNQNDRTLPLIDEPPPESTTEMTGLSGIRVLLAEDSPLNQQLAMELLREAGLEVDLASNGQEAVDLALQTTPCPYDVVLMDVQMPVMDGFEATRQIRRKLPDLPVIALTAHALVGDSDKCLAAGMNDYVSKPIDSTQLFQSIRHWVKPRHDSQSISISSPSVPFLPETMEGIEVSRALQRLGGKQHLYLRLIRNFRQEYLSFSSRFQEALEQNDRKLVSRLVHTLKGAAGSIGASALQKTAAQLEQAIEREEDLEETLAETAFHLSRVLQELANLNPRSSEKPDPDPEKTLDSSRVDELCQELSTLLQAGSFSALEVFARLKQAWGGTGQEELLTSLEKKIEAFAMDEAWEELQQIMKKIPLTDS